MAEVALGVLAASSLSGAGAAILAYGVARTRGRRTRARRLTQLVGLTESAQPSAVSALRARSRPLVSRASAALTFTRAHAEVVSRFGTVLALFSSLIGLVTGNAALLVMVLSGVALTVWLRRTTAVRRRLEQQAAGAFEMLANGLRAGYSIPQAIA